MFRIPGETWMVFIINTIGNLGWSATIPFYAVYLVHRNVPLSIIGATYLATGLFVLLGMVLSGRLTDIFGPKKIILSSYSMSLVWAILLSKMIQVVAPIEWLLLLYPVFSFTRNMSSPATSSIIATQDEKSVRAGFSLLNVGSNLGFAIGPALGGVLSQADGYSSVFILGGVTAVIAGVITLLKINGGSLADRENRPEASLLLDNYRPMRKWLSWKNDRIIILFLLVVAGSSIALGYEITPLSVYVSDFLGFSNTEIGYLFTTNGIVIVIMQLPLTKIWQKWRLLVLPMILSSIFVAAAYLIVAVATSFPVFELAMVVVTLGEIFQTVPSQTTIALFSKSGNRGIYQGYYNAATNAGRSLAFFTGPASFGLFASMPYIAWIIIAMFSLAMGVGFFLISTPLQKSYLMLRKEKENVGF